MNGTTIITTVKIAIIVMLTGSPVESVEYIP